jgi:two-component system, NtrC family, sensor kinase
MGKPGAPVTDQIQIPKSSIDRKKVPEKGHLKVLVVGRPESDDHGSEILDSLLLMGYGCIIIGAFENGLEELVRLRDEKAAASTLRLLRKVVQADPPDLMILNSEDPILRQCLTEMVPPHTKILDSFALTIIRTLKEVAGQLDATKNRLESVELIKEVLMSGPEVSLMVVDEDFNILEISDSLLKRTKMARPDAIDRPCHWIIRKFMEPCGLRGQPCMVEEVLRTGRSVHNVREEIRADNTKRYYTISAYPMKEDDRGKRNVLIVWKDVTRGMTPVLDRQAQNIRENFDHVLRRDKMVALGKLASAAVHEINNPIQGILTFAKLMRKSLDEGTLSPGEEEQFKTYLDLIATESTRCGKILRNLLSFARQGELKKTTVNLSSLFDEIHLLMGHRMELQGIRFKRELEDDLPPIYGDRDQIKQGVLNLLLNAVEALPNGGAIGLVARLGREGSHVIIEISDTGAGIPKEMQANIFEPFYTTKDDGKGVGLGLSVVYGIIAQHGGVIEVESEENEGTTFILTLPVEDGESEKAGS